MFGGRGCSGEYDTPMRWIHADTRPCQSVVRSRANLVHHDIRLLCLRLLLLRRLLGGLLGAAVGSIRAVVHLDILALDLLFALALFVLEVLFLVVLALGLEILRSGVALLVVVLAVGVGAFHVVVVARDLGCNGSSAESSGLAALREALVLFTLELFLFSAVSRTVVLGGIDVRLLWRELGRSALVAVPLDGEAGDTRLLGQDVAADFLDYGLGGGLVDQGLVGVFVVDVVAYAHELAAVVGAGEQDDGHTEDFSGGDVGGVWRVGLEDELVDADGDRADEEGVEFLVMLGAGECSC